MVTWKQVIEKCGQEMADEMIATGLLDGITVTRNPSGEFDIPERDIVRAYHAALGQRSRRGSGV